MNFIETILDGLPKITDDQITRAGKRLDPIKEKEEALGPCSTYSIRLWVLAQELLRQGHLAAHAAVFDTETEEDRAKLETEANRLKAISEVAKDLAWGSCKDDIDKAWDHESVGLRSGFILVKRPTEETDITAISLTAVLKQVFADRVKAATEEAEEKPREEPKTKPS